MLGVHPVSPTITTVQKMTKWYLGKLHSTIQLSKDSNNSPPYISQPPSTLSFWIPFKSSFFLKALIISSLIFSVALLSRNSSTCSIFSPLSSIVSTQIYSPLSFHPLSSVLSLICSWKSVSESAQIIIWLSDGLGQVYFMHTGKLHKIPWRRLIWAVKPSRVNGCGGFKDAGANSCL